MGIYDEMLEKDILDLEKVEFSNLQFDKNDEITEFSALLAKHFCSHYFAKISIDYSNVEGSNEPRIGFSDERYVKELLNCHNFKKVIPELQPFDYEYTFNKPISVVSSLYPLLGALCSCIDMGGAYSSNKLPSDQLITRTKSFIDVFLPNGFRGYNLFTTYEPWSGYFFDIAWDSTFIAFNRNKNEFNIICISDVD